ncbi:MAG: hypothetical protein IJG87_04450 [Ruminococcus sp.]|nr:hypothetical protein [Ruminococcus sp.]
MIVELTEKEPASFDMMCVIVERTLKPLIRKWCYESEDLRNRQYEDDILQDTQIRLFKTCVTHFLKRKDRQYVINDNPDDFCSWIKTVGRNMTRDKAKEVRQQNFHTTKLSPDIPAADDFSKIEDDTREMMIKAFHAAVRAPKNPHIVLTWIMQSALSVSYDVNRIKATQIMEDTVSDRTLFEMWEMILGMLRELPAFRTTQEENDHIMTKLEMKTADHQKVGDTVFREYYGNRGGKAAISDWIYRMNRWLGEQMNYEPFD